MHFANTPFAKARRFCTTLLKQALCVGINLVDTLWCRKATIGALSQQFVKMAAPWLVNFHYFCHYAFKFEFFICQYVYTVNNDLFCTRYEEIIWRWPFPLKAQNHTWIPNKTFWLYPNFCYRWSSNCEQTCWTANHLSYLLPGIHLCQIDRLLQEIQSEKQDRKNSLLCSFVHYKILKVHFLIHCLIPPYL